METAISFFCGLKGFDDGFLFCELACFDGLVDSNEVLMSASTERKRGGPARPLFLLRCSSVRLDGQIRDVAGRIPSEFPISPSGSPTARPWASSSQKGCSFSNLSMTGVFALPIASPSGFPSGGQIPHPSSSVPSTKFIGVENRQCR